MYKFRVNYWSCSKFAKWFAKTFAGIEKPYALTPEEWKQWKENFKNNHKFVYWFTEKFLDDLQDVVFYPLDVWEMFRMFVRNRFIEKTHIINTRLEKGKWHEYDKRLLYGAFELLVDFIELEKAKKTKNDKNRPWWDKLPFYLRFFIWRTPEGSIKYLENEMSLTYGNSQWVEETDPLYGQPTEQAKIACEQLELYFWWKFVRPYRPEPAELAGYHDYIKQRYGNDFDVWDILDERDVKDEQYRKIMNEIQLIEDKQAEEDNEMLMRLIKIRDTLWT